MGIVGPGEGKCLKEGIGKSNQKPLKKYFKAMSKENPSQFGSHLVFPIPRSH
jgi:hypothetical protein